ncbi:YraN family protein [Candidatus Dependentiae bacterium]|nr:YraN family protein [Candidatus Dependentiae bacterium]
MTDTSTTVHFFKRVTKDIKQFGQQAEQAVAHALCKNGFTILAQNYSVRGGEIDIIAADKDTVVFIEVKARRTNYFDIGHVITRQKQRKIIQTAQLFLAKHPQLYNKVCRFDVALIEQTEPHTHVTYIADAFNL